MGATPIYSLPYPELSDAPDGPAQLEALADAVEAELARVDADIAAMADPPIAILRKTSGQSTTSGTDATVTWDAAIVDSHGGWSAGSPTRYTAQLAGWYEVAGHVMWGASTSGRRMAWLWHNGSSVIGSRQIIWPATSETVLCVARGLVPLAAGDFVEVRVAQNSGGSLDIASGTNQAASALNVVYRRPL